jgi:hypothetical protein
MKVYLSGPMTGLPDFNHPKFNAEASRLRGEGYEVLNPAENDNGSQDKTRAFYIRLDMNSVLNSDAVLVLPGWQTSAGARLEVEMARQLGLPIYKSLSQSVGELEELSSIGTFGKGDSRFHALLQQIGALHDKKQSDYGKDTDPFANVRASRNWGVAPWVGALVRLNDKVSRLQSFATKGSLANESAEDSMMDIAVYALIALILYREESIGDDFDSAIRATVRG